MRRIITGPSRLRRGFTMIEVLTVAAIAVIILSLTIPAFAWMTDARDRERVQEAIGAQVMAARSLAVQYRTYAGVSVRSLTGVFANTQCGGQKSGVIRLIQCNPRDVNDAVWNKSFYWVQNRTATSIPNGVGFCNGYRPTAGTALADVTAAQTFFIIFGPDGVIRRNWPVDFLYVNTDGNLGWALLNSDRSADIAGNSRNNCLATNRFRTNGSAFRFSTNCFAVYDFRRLQEETGGGSQSTQVSQVTNPAGLLNRLYTPGGVNAMVRDDLLCKRSFLNPYTGLAIQETNSFDPNNPAVQYRELDP